MEDGLSGRAGSVSIDPRAYPEGSRRPGSVAIARARANDPSIILADEPTGNLDSKTGEEIIGLFVKLQKEGRTILMVTRDTKIAAYSQRTIRLLDGRIV